jgi:hypothetical protein
MLFFANRHNPHHLPLPINKLFRLLLKWLREVQDNANAEVRHSFNLTNLSACLDCDLFLVCQLPRAFPVVAQLLGDHHVVRFRADEVSGLVRDQRQDEQPDDGNDAALVAGDANVKHARAAQPKHAAGHDDERGQHDELFLLGDERAKPHAQAGNVGK